MKGSAFRTAVGAVLAVFAVTALAQEAKPPAAGPRFEFHGFIGGSVFAQDGITAPNYAHNSTYAALGSPNTDRITFGGDARETRLNFSITGPTRIFGGAIPSGVAELDFLGGWAAGGANANIAVTPRLRLAYAQLNYGNFILRLGQDADLIQGGISPASVGHVGTPLVYNAGYVGNRHAGLFLFETLPLSKDSRVELALQVSRSQGNDAAIDPFANGTTTAPAAGSAIATSNQLSYADSSGLPMVEARIKYRSTPFEVFVAGTWNRIDLSGNNASPNDAAVCSGATGAGCPDRDVIGGVFGIKLLLGPITLQGNGNIGKNMTVHNAAIGQTQTGAGGDLHSYAGWAQLGFNLTKTFSVWGLAGTERMNFSEIQRLVTNGTLPTNRLQNIVYSGMLRWMDGGWAVGLEGTHWTTKYIAVTAPSDRLRHPNGVVDVNQLMLSGLYFF